MKNLRAKEGDQGAFSNTTCSKKLTDMKEIGSRSSSSEVSLASTAIDFRLAYELLQVNDCERFFLPVKC